MIRRLLAELGDRVLNWFAPPPLTDVIGPNDLADIEAQLDGFEPDELWAAQERFSTPWWEKATGNSPSPVRPADATPARGVGGLFKSDEQIIEELVADYREFVRDCFKQRRG